MEYEKHIKRLVLGYLKKDCKNAYKVFLKYNFHNQNKHIPTRVAGQTLEDILRIYSRIEEIVQGHLEDTNYYKERSVEFSSPIYLDDQLLYLLEKDRPFTASSTPCPRSPAESSVVESQHDNEVFATNDIETTPEHTLPGNISSQDEDQSKTPFRKGSSPIFATPCLEKLPISNKEATSEVKTTKVPEKKLISNITPALNTPDISCFPHRGENEKNKEGVGTEFDDMLQHFLSTSDVNTVSKAVSAESTTPARSSNRTHSTTSLKNWHGIDDHNNRAVSSLLAAAQMPSTKSASFVTTTNDHVGYNDNLNNFQEQPASSGLQVGPAATNFANNQYLLPTSVGMYIVPQSATSAAQSSNQQQQFYIVNQPVCIPQQAPVMQFLQPLAPANNNPVVMHPNQNTPLIKDNNMRLSEQDIMTMPTIIINECNEITHADSGSFPITTPLKGKEAHNLKEYINLYGATDQSPILNLKRPGQKKGSICQPPLKPTPTIKVEIFQREGLPTSAIGTSNTNNSERVSSQANIGSGGCKGLPNLNDFAEGESVETIQEDSTKLINKKISDETTNKSKIESHGKSKPMVVDAICTPSPLETVVRKPTPKSNSHVRNLSFPSPNKKTSEKIDPKRSSPRIINKQQATKDLFRSASEDEIKSDTKLKKVTKQSTKSAKTPTKVVKRTPKQSKKKCSKSPIKNLEKGKTKSSKEITNTEVVKENASKPVEKDVSPKYCWDSNLRKLIPPIIEKHATPSRRVSARKKARPSLELDTTDIDGKKLEEALKTPDKIEKPKRKTPSRKINPKISKTKKLEDNLESHDSEAKGETKILSPSKLNANKRNILLNDVDDVTPNILKDPSQYPITSKTRRNISSLLETPIKDDFIPPTPGEVTDKTDTPFTPMLRANLKDFTGGDSYSINTPNFPVTPGFAAMVNTSAAYYILNDNESNKVTEATVLLEEKKSSVRKSDDEDIELSPIVYGSKDILDNFNKSCVGKKNLELLDNRGVTWDGSSDREEKSRESSENNSEDESNNTVIQTQKVELPNEMKVLSRKSKGSGKCMATLQLLKEVKDQPEDVHAPEFGNQKEEGAKIQGDEKNYEHSVGDKLQANTIIKSCSSGSESEVLSKKSYNINKLQVLSTDSDSEKLSKLQDNLLKIGENVVDKNIERNKSNKNITQGKYNITTQEVRQTISDVCLEENLGQKSTTVSLKAQLEEKKKRWIELEKAKQPLGTRKAPSRRAVLKPQPKLNPERRARKSQSPKRVVKSNQQKETLQSQNENKKDIGSSMKESEVIERESDLGMDTEYHTVDSQDEFFKKSGTNLHRKSKATATNTVPELRKEDDGKMGDNPVANEISHDNMQISNKVDKNENDQKILEDQLNKPVVVKNSAQDNLPKMSQNMSTASNNPDEFEKSWEDCHTSAFESEQVVVYHDESKTPDKKLEDYNVSILQKKIVLGVPCSDGSIVSITLTASSFDTLLEIKPSDECEMTDGSRDEVDSSFETLELKPEAVSDSEHPGSKPDNADFKCGKKRKHRSDSCNSNSSAKKIKTKENMLNEMNMLKQMNIQTLLTKIYGPEKTKGSLE